MPDHGAGDETASEPAPAARTSRFPRIQALTLALAGATTLDEILDVVVDQGIEAAGAAAGIVFLFTPETGELEVARNTGYRPDLRPGDTVDIPRGELPTWTAIETDAPVVVDVGRDAARYPQVCERERARGHDTLVAVPITAGQVPFGALCLSFGPDIAVTRPELDLYELVGRHVGAAVERSRLLEADRAAREALDHARDQAETARDRLAFLVRVGRTVLGTLDPTEVLERVVHHAVPRIADAGMALRPVEGGLGRVAVAHGNPDIDAGARRHLLGTVVPYDAAAPAAECFRTGEIIIHRDLDDDQVVDVPTRFREKLEENSLRYWLCVPIRTETEVHGVLALAWTQRHPLDDPEHLDLTVELAARAATGLVNAKLYETQRGVALALKTSVLPAVLPEVQGLDIAARYLPSGSDVGGDWYDALVLDDGRIALTIGDVSGHGLAAGGAMGQLRNAVRAYALDGHGPAAVLTRLNRVLARTDRAHVASAVHLVVDPVTGVARWSSAGHPPCLVVDADGARTLPPTSGPLLGATDTAEYEEAEIELAVGGSIVLYTDGLIERRDESIDASIGRLLDVLRGATVASADDLCELALGIEEQPSRDDDVCILVARRI